MIHSIGFPYPLYIESGGAILNVPLDTSSIGFRGLEKGGLCSWNYGSSGDGKMGDQTNTDHGCMVSGVFIWLIPAKKVKMTVIQELYTLYVSQHQSGQTVMQSPVYALNSRHQWSPMTGAVAMREPISRRRLSDPKPARPIVASASDRTAESGSLVECP